MSGHSIYFEQGPIRPPSEAGSLLIRLSRNCPWNSCVFCPVYKHDKFSRRSIDEIKEDIDNIAMAIEEIKAISIDLGFEGLVTGKVYEHLSGSYPHWLSALNWLYYNQGSVFLQDADNMIYRGEFLYEILDYLKSKITGIIRITTYARSKSITKRSPAELSKLKDAGLDRIHVGLESGSDEVLSFMKKGATAAEHIEAGSKIKNAGLTLSEYVILGLGGESLWHEHAMKTAKVLNEINPHFIRVRTLAVHPATPLMELTKKGAFKPLNDDGILREKRLMIDNLEGIGSSFHSDHILNLLEEVEGVFPENKQTMLDTIDYYFALPKRERELFRLGRRTGIMRYLEDLKKKHIYNRTEELYRAVKDRGLSVDGFIDEMRTNFL